MDKSFDVYDVTALASILEQLGTKEKFWFKGYWDDFDEDWLFKYSRKKTGEHWSEKIAEQLCGLLEIPHAEYYLAESKGRLGVITKNLVPNGYSMIMGNQLLYAVNPQEYPQPENKCSFMHIREHTIDSIFGALTEYHVLPPGEFKYYDNQTYESYDLKPPTPNNMISPEGMDACDVFCGYLMLDALISNQDRHHENWAILEDQKGKRYLCPSFDHAASLGRELLDDERTERLKTKDRGRQISHFVSRATSEIFSASGTKKPLSTLDAFFESVKDRALTKKYWLSRLETLSEKQIISLLDRIPDRLITPVARDFAVAMIFENKKRLLEYE